MSTNNTLYQALRWTEAKPDQIAILDDLQGNILKSDAYSFAPGISFLKTLPSIGGG